MSSKHAFDHLQDPQLSTKQHSSKKEWAIEKLFVVI